MWTKKRKKRASPAWPSQVNELWSMDFVQDKLGSGAKFRTITLVDVFTRECLALLPGTSLSGQQLAELLDQVAALCNYPKQITGQRYRVLLEARDSWAYRHGVQLDFIRPGRPMENGHRELQREAPRRMPKWRAMLEAGLMAARSSKLGGMITTNTVLTARSGT